MYAQIDNFPVDKAVNTIIEEGIAPIYVREYHRQRGFKVLRVDKNLGSLEQGRRYDLFDSTGTTWEVKNDRLWHVTGNVYVEIQALEASTADKYLIFAGKGYVIAKSALWEAITAHLDRVKVGGDRDASLGVCLPLETLENASEAVLVL